MRHLYPGDMQLIERGQNHEFRSDAGCIIEEISTTHIPKDDSFYDDETIAADAHRKTEMTFWADWLISPPR